VIERGYVASGKISEQDLDRVLDVLSMTRPAE
jgi:fumarate hydratase class II